MAKPPLKGFYLGKNINAINSRYETVRYDDGLKFSTVYLIVGFLDSLFNFFSLWSAYRLGICLSKTYRNKMMRKYLSFHYTNKRIFKIYCWKYYYYYI